MIAPKSILLTIDVEDWFQVENFKSWIPFETWDQRELRVEKNVHRLLDLMDSVELKNQAAQSSKLKAQSNNDWDHSKIIPENTINPVNSDNPINKFSKAVSMQPPSLSEADHYRSNIDRSSRLFSGASQQQTTCNAQLTKHNPQLTTNKSHAAAPASNLQPPTSNSRRPRCTFFILGWLADRLPNLVREIQNRGHEIASHGYNHQRPDQLSAAELKMDLADSKKRLEDLIGSPVSGYRAPSFAINDDILKIIEDCGYLYDSSYNSFGLHGRYGRISLNGAGKCGLAHKVSDNFFELPVSNLFIKNPFSSGRNKNKRIVLPLGGGGYFRLIPGAFFRLGIKHILTNEGAYLFYMHPWEVDPGQPHVKEASANFKFRHYCNLNNTYQRLEKLIASFQDCSFITCSQYLEKQ